MTTEHDDNFAPDVNREPMSPMRRRLSNLKATPVEMNSLRRAIESEIARPGHQPSLLRLFRPIQAVAASFLLMAVVVALVLAYSSGPALASPERMAVVYHEMLAGHHSHAVSSLSEAEQVLRKQWADLPSVPVMPTDTAVSCCVHEMAGRRMACVAVNVDGVVVSIATAPAGDFSVPKGQTRTIGGHEYLVESANGVNMVMTKRSGTWVCVMSTLDSEALISFVEKLKW